MRKRQDREVETYYREHDTRQAMENYARWGGDGDGLYGGCAIAWDEQTAEERETRRLQTHFPVIAEEASITKAVLARMHEVLSAALCMYHLSNRTLYTQARHCDCSERTYRNRLHEAHVAYWQQRSDHQSSKRLHQAAYAGVRRHIEVDIDKPFTPPKAADDVDA